MIRLNPIGPRNTLILLAVAGLLTGPNRLDFAAACLLLALAAMLAPSPGPSIARAWGYLLAHHPVLACVVGVAVALAAAALAWAAVVAVPLLLVGSVFA